MTASAAQLTRTAPVWLVLLPGPLAAQNDYRNLDDDRPTRVEDAYPVERYAFELILPYGLEREEGATLHFSSLELAYGLFPNMHIGVKAPVAALRASGQTEWGLAGLRVFTLYNFNTEGPVLPALSLRADALLSVGAFGPGETRVSLKAIMTRSWGRTRVHLNGGYGFGPDRTPAAVDPVDHYWIGAAVDHTLIRQSTLIVTEVYVAESVAGEPAAVSASLGMRHQLRPTTVLDLGLTRGGVGGGPDVALTVGFSQTFAVPWLMPRGRP